MALLSSLLRRAERRVHQAEARAVLAEEQLAQTNKYMAKATFTYQAEIMRLRSALSAHSPGAAGKPKHKSSAPTAPEELPRLKSRPVT